MRRFQAAIVVFLSLLASLAAQGQRAMTLVDIVEIPRLRDPQLAPDGRSAVFVLSEGDWEDNKSTSHIWLSEESGESWQLTRGESGERSPRWSPDGQWIAFLAKRGDDEHNQIYLLRTAGGEARRLSEHETAVSSIEWSPDGQFLYFTASDPKSPEEKALDKLKYDVYPLDEDYRQRHLWKVDAESGEETRITEGDYSISGYALSRDGARIAHHRAPSPLFDDQDEGEVWVMDADGGNALQLTDNTVTERGARLSPDNSTVLFRSGSNEDFETYYNSNLFLVPAAGGEFRLLMEDLPFDVGSSEWSQDGNSIFFVANTGLRSELFVLEPGSGDVRQITRGDHAIRSWSWDPRSGRHIFTRGTADNPGDVWTLSSESDQMRRWTHVYDYLAEDFRLPKLERVEWKGEDGVTVEGLLYYPLDYQPGQRYPLIVQTHGGPAASDKFGFPRGAIPKMAAMGYAVFRPNYRGSTGYGDDFLRDMVGHYFQNAHLDVMAGVDHLIERGIADGERMAKMGWSAGGHMTNKIITHTDRFKAAASGAGAVNWISMYGQSDVRIYRTPWFGGTPWEKDAPIDVYWENSPLSDIWKVATPTLVLVGENDVRVPPPQSVELYRALRTNGVPTKLYIAPREPHGWRELRHRLFRMNVELDWFERYVRGKEYEWEYAPGDEEKIKKKEKEAETVEG